jgi:hypothetical protein
MTSYHLIPHMARLSRDPLYIGFLGPIHLYSTDFDEALNGKWPRGGKDNINLHLNVQK